MRNQRWIGGMTALTIGLMLAATPVAADEETFRLSALDGGAALQPADVESGAVIMIFWAGWSPRCRDIVERTNAIADEWGGRARVITINFQEEPDAVRDFLDGELKVPTYLDGDGAFSKQHTMTSLPGLLIYDDGEVAFRGKLPADPSGLIAQTLN